MKNDNNKNKEQNKNIENNKSDKEREAYAKHMANNPAMQYSGRKTDMGNISHEKMGKFQANESHPQDINQNRYKEVIEDRNRDDYPHPEQNLRRGASHINDEGLPEDPVMRRNPNEFTKDNMMSEAPENKDKKKKKE